MANNQKKNQSDTKRALIIVGSIILGLALFVGLILFLDKKTDESVANEYKEYMEEYPDKQVSDLNQGTIDSFKDENYRLVMSPKTIDKKINNKEDVYIYFYSPLCVHCQTYTPILMDYIDSNKALDNVHFLNILEYEEYWDKYQITGTPTMVHFVNGKESNRFAGELTEAETVQFFDDEQAVSDKAKNK